MPTSQPALASQQPPNDQFAPFAPSEDEPWNVVRANHLLRRIAFGPTRERLDAILKLSPGGAIDSLLDYDPKKDPFEGMVEQMEGLFNLRDIGQAQQWWIYRMIYSPQPAQEKIALFWHNRFATSATKVENGVWMTNQIEMFRRQGLGSFVDLVINVERDPAMLIWLDGKDSRKGKPNENFAREVMELFTLGIGNYTEDDVKQLARCFTGWRIDGDEGNFHRDQFDNGQKTVFGTQGNFDAVDAIHLILKQPAAPKFLAKKMLREFVHPEPTDEQIDHYAARLRDTDWNIKIVLREMLASRMFFSEWSYRSRIKSPVELVIGSAIAMGGKPNTSFLREQMAKMGQNVLFPPNVKGWDGNEAWINANTVLVRFNFGMTIATGRNFGTEPMAKQADLKAPLEAAEAHSADDVIEAYARLLLDGRLVADAKEKLLDYMNHDAKDQLKPFVLNDSTINYKVRDMLHMMMSVPEYQLA